MNKETETVKVKVKVKSESAFTWQKAITFVMFLLTTLVIVDIVIDYKMQPLLDEIASLKQSNVNKPDVRVINTRAMAEHFAQAGYDTRTELEYIDILKILLDKSNIIGIKEDSLQFKGTKYELKLNDIETLRQSLADLGIENPRINNEAEYAERENLQREVFRKLTGQISIQQ
ncbi:hypothetical protein [Shewanella algicola]|uniref:Uncharacterized protein n=1 Tax=Shewanella algicola TaxID=640633 RepID=A0A9X2CAP7_9GAMM|nr:hypothetical protein [Shewanella algicola]MCL1106345.1 hypothetical protein [Shewanella algicola]